MKIILSLALMCCLTAVSASNPSTPGEGGVRDKLQNRSVKVENNLCDDKRCANSPPVVSVNPTISVNEQLKCKENCEEHGSTVEGWTAGATVALAVVTAALAFFTFRLWQSTKGLVEETKDTGKKELRAYLGATPADIKFLGSNHIQTNIEITNTGQTPARNVTQAIRMEIRNPTDNKNFPRIPPISGKRPIVPGASWTFRDDLANVTNEQLESLRTKELVIFVWGRAEYTDIFGDVQSIDFRYQNIGVVFVQNPEGRDLIGWALYPEEDGNDAT